MRISDEFTQKIKDRKLMALGSWILVVFFGGLSLIAKSIGHGFIDDILLGASILFGTFFVFFVLALMLTAASLIAQRTKDRM